MKLYSPEEAARYLDIAIASLAYYRRTGRISGIPVGGGSGYVYTEEELATFKAALDSGEARKRPGPKPRKKSKQADGDEPSVTMGQKYASRPLAECVA